MLSRIVVIAGGAVLAMLWRLFSGDPRRRGEDLCAGYGLRNRFVGVSQVPGSRSQVRLGLYAGAAHHGVALGLPVVLASRPTPSPSSAACATSTAYRSQGKL